MEVEAEVLASEVAEAEVVEVVAVVPASEEAAVVVEEAVAKAVVWVPESVSTLDCHKSMRRSLSR